MVGLLTVVLLAFTAVLSFRTLAAQVGTPRANVAAEFQNPPRQYHPHARTWIPQAAEDESVLRAQVDDLAKAGIGDVEIVGFDINRGGGRGPAPTAGVALATPAPPPIDTAVYGWGTPNWTKTMATVLDEAGKYGVKVTFAMGP